MKPKESNTTPISKSKKIVRKFTINPKRGGAAAFLAGSTAEGIPLHSMTRNGNEVTAIYSAD